MEGREREEVRWKSSKVVFEGGRLTEVIRKVGVGRVGDDRWRMIVRVERRVDGVEDVK